MNDLQTTKVITGKVRLSYLHVFEAVAIDGGDTKKFSVSLVIPKGDKKTLKAIEGAINAAKEIGKAKWGGKIPANLKLPLRDGDIDRPDDDTYADCFFLNASCSTRPGVVDKNRNPILSQEELYSGCFGLASINFYAFNTNGNRGIACGLNNLMKTADGEPLGGRCSAESDFADIQFEPEDDFMA